MLLGLEYGGGVSQDELLDQAGRYHAHTHFQDLFLYQGGDGSGRVSGNAVVFHEVVDNVGLVPAVARGHIVGLA